MKAIALLSSSLAAVLFWSGASQAAPPSLELAACIHNNASRVEQAVPNLNEALSYLVYGICAAPLNAQYEQALRLREQQRRADLFKICENAKPIRVPNAADSDKTITNPLCSPEGSQSVTNSESVGEDVREYGGTPRSAEAMSLAASVLLEFRLAHQNSKSP
jgi:hypothetical protein